MDRLSIVLSLIVGSALTGTLVIVVLTLGWYSWLAIGGATAVGFLATWPVSYVLSRRIKRQDMGWDETGVAGKERVVPDVNAPEV
jgi:hypothetical protein